MSIYVVTCVPSQRKYTVFAGRRTAKKKEARGPLTTPQTVNVCMHEIIRKKTLSSPKWL